MMYEVLISHLRECAKLDPNENTFNEAADAIEELLYKYKKALSDLAKGSKSNWVPVTERLPEKPENYPHCERGGQFYSGRISNDDHKAVEILDQFTKAFCIDASVTDDLQFRCIDCEFEMPDGTCLVKKMARKLCPDYKDFGSMGDL